MWPDADSMRERFGYVPETIGSAMHALDRHLEYFEWQGTADYVDRMESFYAAYTGDGKKVGATDPFVTDDASLAASLMADESRNIDMARTVWVQSDICTYIEHAVQNMPPAILHEENVPLDNGLFIFDRPLVYWDYVDHDHGDQPSTVPLRAVAWGTSGAVGRSDGSRGTGLFFWIYTERDWIDVKFKDEFEAKEWPLLHGPSFVLMDLTAWLFNDELWSESEEGVMKADQFGPVGPKLLRPHSGLLRRYMLALFLFMQEEIVGVTDERPPRPARRRAERSGKKMPDDGSIRIVHLRRRKHHSRAEDDEADRREVEWSHRWIVRAHWRQITDKDGRPRLIPVREHTKGPEDKPLVIKDKIISVDR